MEAEILEQARDEGQVRGGEAFEQVSASEGQAQPEALGPRAGEEGAAGEALGVDGVAEVEIADVADHFYIVQGERDDAPAEVEKVEVWTCRVDADERAHGQIAGDAIAGEAADYDFFLGAGHTFVGRMLDHSRTMRHLHREKAANRWSSGPRHVTLTFCVSYLFSF